MGGLAQCPLRNASEGEKRAPETPPNGPLASFVYTPGRNYLIQDALWGGGNILQILPRTLPLVF